MSYPLIIQFQNKITLNLDWTKAFNIQIMRFFSILFNL